MKAIVQSRYCSPADLELAEIERPVPDDDEVLIRVHATSAHPDVWHAVTGYPYVLRLMGAGVRRPTVRVPGLDMAGTVEEAGEAVDRFESGDAVFGESIAGHQWHNGATYAEYVAVPAHILAEKPANVSFEEAAAVPTSGLIALSALDQGGKLSADESVLVNGAAGGVGHIAVQLARAAGAAVTGVDAGDKLDMVRDVGAERVIDYMETDFTRTGERYDRIIDVPGNHSFGDCRRVLEDDGLYVLVGHDHYGTSGGRFLGSIPQALWLLVRSRFTEQLPWDVSRPPKGESMARLAALLESGDLTPVVDRTYPLAETPAALEYLASGQIRGKVVITV